MTSSYSEDIKLIDEPPSDLDRRSATRRAHFWQLWVGERTSFAATFFTTLAIFGIFMIQGIFVARMLGPTARGEFGSALFFPRDILLYAGLLGAVEIVAGYAARGHRQLNQLRFSAARLGLTTGALTAVLAGALSSVVLLLAGKAYIIPYCLLVCLFVPFEHIHISVSAADRGSGHFTRYNVNRLVFAASFPILVLVAWQTSLATYLGTSELLLVCCLWVAGRLLGLLPTLRGWQFVQQFRLAWKQYRASNRWRAKQPLSTRRLLGEGRPYALSMLVSEAFDRLDIFLILALADVTTSGYYFVAVPAASLLIIAPNSLSIFTFNAGTRHDVVPTRRQAGALIGATMLFQLFSVVVLGLLLGFLIPLVYGVAFTAAIPFALWLLPASAMKGLLQAADGYLKGRGKPVIGVWSRGVSLVLMLGFVALFFQQWGILTIPISACFGQFCSMVLILTALMMDVGERQTEVAESASAKGRAAASAVPLDGERAGGPAANRSSKGDQP